MDEQTILWTDTDVYQRRYEKTATALMAVERALRARRPLEGGEDEFLSLYAALAAADPDTFTIIWEDPFAYFWARLAYELTGWCLNPEPLPSGLAKYCAALGTEEPRRALALHLEEFKKFIIALDMKSGVTRRFDHPLRTELPFSIPGTRLSVLGRGPIMVVGTHGESLEVVHDGTSRRLTLDDVISDSSAPRLVRRPVVPYGDFEPILKPETFSVPSIDGSKGFLELEEDFQQKQIPLVMDALALIERHQSVALEHLRELVQVIAFKPSASGDYSNVSFSDLPGAFVLSAVQDPYWIADGLIHELLHNRLFFIVDRGELLEGVQDATERSEFYSPWRDDLRPMSGLLHAVYVYIGVCKFWFSVWKSGETTDLRRDYTHDQAVRSVLDLEIGIAQLRRHATFTEAGIELFKEIEREVDRLVAALPALKLSAGTPAIVMRGDGHLIPYGLADDGRQLTVLESIFAHARQFDVHHQCDDLKSILNLA